LKRPSHRMVPADTPRAWARMLDKTENFILAEARVHESQVGR
jgi:hypothetical protein